MFLTGGKSHHASKQVWTALLHKSSVLNATLHCSKFEHSAHNLQATGKRF